MEILYTSYLIIIISLVNWVLSLFKKKDESSLYCGLIGFSGKEDSKVDLSIIQMLVVWNSLERGTDSIGLYTKESGIKKSIDYPYRYIKDNDICEIIEKSKDTLIHVRKSSVGVNNVRNAHPFKFNNIIGAHNGTLIQYDSLASQYGISYSSYFVDSEVILNAFSQDLKNNNLNVLNRYKGTATLLMYDDIREVFYVYKDSSRPLFHGKDSGGNLYISSLAEPLEFCDLTEVTSFEDDHFYVIKDGNIIYSKDISKKSSSHEYSIIKQASMVDLKFHDKTKFHSDTYTGIYEYCLKKSVGIDTLIGYRVQLNKKPLLFKNLLTTKRYLVTGVNDKLNEVKITDGLNSYYVELECLNVSNFIPIKNKIVRAVEDLNNNKGKRVIKKGQYLTVTKHSFPDKKIIVAGDDKKEWIIDKESVELLTITEERDYRNKLENTYSMEFNIDKILLENVQKV